MFADAVIVTEPVVPLGVKVVVEMFVSTFLPNPTTKIHKSGTVSLTLKNGVINTIAITNGGTGYTDVNNGGTFSSTAYEDYRWMSAAASPNTNVGAWSGSWADDTSYRFLMSLGKAGSAWTQGGYTNTGMQFQHLRQDFEVFQIAGARGHTDFN